MVELVDAPAVVEWTNARRAGIPADRAAGVARAQTVRNAEAQAALLGVIARAVPGARFLFRVQKAYNGIALLGDARAMSDLAALPGVKAVHRIPLMQPSNASSIPLIGSPAVWQNLSVTGSNIKIGVIDTGIDYTHTGFGGSGSAGDLTAARASAANPSTTGTTYLPGFTVTNGLATIYPTAKVAGGWDFAGDAYTGSNTPAPDPNPLDCEGHGTHVAGTIAGYGVNSDGTTYTGPWNNTIPFSAMRIGPGHAPEAKLYPLRVFGCSGSTYLTTQAIDWATDPNGDDDFSDHLDVVNLSLGSPFGSPDAPETIAADNAANAGVIVVVSAGNSGDVYYVSGSPGTAKRAITVASSYDDTDVVDGFRVESPGPATVYGATKSAYFNWASPPRALPSNVNLYYPSANQYGCSAWTGADLTNINGRVVLVDWTKPGDTTYPCGSATRANNAYNAGAVGIIMVDAQSYATASISGNTTIPAMYTISTVGTALKANLTAGAISSENVTFDASLMSTFFTAGLTDKLSSFTSRGPRPDGGLKPDVTAVGDGIYSVAAGTYNRGESLSGTSMAAPQVAGTMALLRQIRPTWTVEQLKALVMNTATRDLYTGLSGTGDKYGNGRVGAGRISSLDASQNTLLAYNADTSGSVSVSFGAVEVSGTLQADRTIAVANMGSGSVTVSLAYSSVVSIPGVTYSFPDGTSFSVAAGATATFRIRLSADASLMKNSREATVAEYQGANRRQWVSESTGNVVLTPSSGSAIRVPVYAAARPASSMSTVETEVPVPTDTSTATLTLSGTGVNTGATPPADIKSVVTPLELAATSALATLPAGATSMSREADLKYVGVTAVRRSTSSGSRVNNSTVLFGIVTHGNWGSPAEVEFDVDIDTNNDGGYEYVLFNTRLTDTDTLVSALYNYSTQSTVSSSYSWLNQYSAYTPTAPFNSNVIVLPLEAAKLNMGSNTRFTYKVSAYTDRGKIDETAALTYDYANPGLDFNASGTAAVMYDDLPAQTIPINFNGPAYRLNKSQGVLLLHHYNLSGSREQVVPLACNTITVTNPTTAAASTGVAFSVSFTRTGGLGTVTFAKASGTLPGGLTLATNGTLSGSPTQIGTFPITVTATDGMGCSGTGATYNLVVSMGAPAIAATGSTSQVTVAWSAVPGAAGYQVYRKDHGGALALIASPVTAGFTDTAVSANSAYVYQVKAVDASSNTTTSNLDIATTVAFTDDPLASGSTVIRGVHLTQLRTAVNAALAAAGIAPVTFTDAAPAGIFIRAVHITELRSQLTNARSALGLSPPLFADAGPAAGDRVKAAHFQEIRDGVK